MKNIKKILFYAVLYFFITACSAKYYGLMTSESMNKLKLGMSVNEVTNILGTNYKISENKIEEGKEMKTLSYRNANEFYQFKFENGTLKEWNRELVPEVQQK